MCEPCGNLEEEFALLDAVTVVDTVRVDIIKPKSRGTERRRAICTLWCGSSHPPGDLRQPMVACNETTVPGIEHALRALRLKIVEQHAGCLAVAEAARATAAGPATRPPTDALSALMAGKKTQQAYDRAEAAVKAAVARRDALSVQLAEAELEVVTLTAAAQTAGSQLPLAKRQRKHGPLLRWQTETSLWDLAMWNEKEKEEQERRAVRIDASASQLQPRTGVDGCLQHWRRGLISAVQSWARGCKANVVYMLMALVSTEHGFGIEAEVRERLAGEQLRDAETDTYIVDRAVAALSTLKRCGTEETRQQYHVVLGALAPTLAEQCNQLGMARRVSDRLGVRRDRRARTKKQKEANEPGRPFAFLQASVERYRGQILVSAHGYTFSFERVCSSLARPWRHTCVLGGM
jgi:hypothetical protein